MLLLVIALLLFRLPLLSVILLIILVNFLHPLLSYNSFSSVSVFLLLLIFPQISPLIIMHLLIMIFLIHHILFHHLLLVIILPVLLLLISLLYSTPS